MILYNAKLKFHFHSDEVVEFETKEMEFYGDNFTINARGIGEPVKRVVKICEEAVVSIVSDEFTRQGVQSVRLLDVVPSVDSSLELAVTGLLPQFVHFTVLESSKSLFFYKQEKS